MAYQENAVALQPIRTDEKNNRFIYYTAMTWAKNPAGHVDMYLRRIGIFGPSDSKKYSPSPLAVDLLAENGDILDTVEIDRRSFEYLRSQLHFRRARE